MKTLYRLLVLLVIPVFLAAPRSTEDVAFFEEQALGPAPAASQGWNIKTLQKAAHRALDPIRRFALSRKPPLQGFKILRREKTQRFLWISADGQHMNDPLDLQPSRLAADITKDPDNFHRRGINVLRLPISANVNITLYLVGRFPPGFQTTEDWHRHFLAVVLRQKMTLYDLRTLPGGAITLVAADAGSHWVASGNGIFAINRAVFDAPAPVARSLVRSGLARAIPAHTTPPVRKLGRVKLNRLGDLRNLIGFSGSHEEQSFEWLTQKAALAQPLDNDLREVINIRQRHTEKMLKLQDKLTDPHDSRRPAQGATLNDVDRRAWVEAREAFVSRKLINDIGIRAIHAYIYFLAYRFIARNPSLVGKEKTLYQLATQHLIRIVFPRYDPRFALTTVITQECLGVFTRAVRKLVPEFHFVPFGQLGLAKKIRAEISTSQLSGDTAPKPEELAIKLRTPIHRIRLLLESLRRGRTVSSDVVVVQPTPTSDQPPQRSPSSVSQALSEARGKLERFSFAAIIAFRLLHDEIEPSSLSQVAELFGVSTEELTRRLEDERTQAREAKSPATDARRPKMRWADLDNLVPWLKALRGRDLVPAHRLVDSILNVERRWIEPAELAQLRDLTNADALIVIFLRQLWREPTLRIGDISIIKLLHASS